MTRESSFFVRRIGSRIAALLLAAGTASAAFSTVVIDPGHGGSDRGGIRGQRVPEKDMALDVAKRVRDRLSAAGLNVVMTRSRDTTVSLASRVRVANARPRSVFVSIHFNSARRVGADGIETFYYSSRAAKLAANIHPRVVRVAGTTDRGVRRRALYVLRKTSVPAVLVECGFLTNPAESRRVLQAAHRDRLAWAIATGILVASKQ